MYIDLTIGGKLLSGHAAILEQVAKEVRGPFAGFISELSCPHSDDLDWWVEAPASRNTYVSTLFHYCRSFALLKKLIQDGVEVSTILVDSPAFKGILDDYFSGAVVSPEIIVLQKKKFSWIRKRCLSIRCFLEGLSQFACARLSRIVKRQVPKEPVVLIDTFVVPGFAEEDRYYTGLWECLASEEKRKVFFVPTFYRVPFWGLLGVFKQLRGSERNFLLKEDFLGVKDYLFAFQHCWRIRKMKVPEVSFLGFSFSSIVNEELQSLKGVPSAFGGLLNFRFAMRLKDSSVRLAAVIDWFENQAIDKGWNYGFNTFYPDVEKIGYQGFVASPHYLCQYPTDIERRNAMLPNKIAVIGKGLIDGRKEFCPDLSVIKAPAFRFGQVWKDCVYPVLNSGFDVLVSLPIDVDEGSIILRLLEDGLGRVQFSGVNIFVKPHPTTSPEQVRKAYLGRWPEVFTFAAGDFNKWIEKVHMVVGSASSTSLEALAKGVPVIIIGNPHGLTHNPIPESIKEDIWRLCRTPDEFAEAMSFYRERDRIAVARHESIGRRIREEFFEPVTEDGVRKFLGLDGERK